MTVYAHDCSYFTVFIYQMNSTLKHNIVSLHGRCCCLLLLVWALHVFVSVIIFINTHESVCTSRHTVRNYKQIFSLHIHRHSLYALYLLYLISFLVRCFHWQHIFVLYRSYSQHAFFSPLLLLPMPLFSF